MNDYYSDDGMISNSFLQAILRGPYFIKQFFDRIGKRTKKKHYILGNAVDHLLTDPSTFREEFSVVDFDTPSEKITNMVEGLLDSISEPKTYLNEYPDYLIHDLCKEYDWFAKDSYKNSRVKKFFAEGARYYSQLLEHSDKYVLNTSEYQNVVGLANLMETHRNTASFFELERMDGVKCGKQVRINWTCAVGNSGMHPAKVLLDRFYINTTDKDIEVSNGFIFPAKSMFVIDYKTTSGFACDFLESFYKFRYDFQGAFYYGAANYQAQIIKSKKKETFKVLPPVFIVGSFASDYTVWYQMTMDDIKRGRHGDNETKGYFDAVKLYEQYKESGQWEIPPSLLSNFGKLE